MYIKSVCIAIFVHQWNANSFEFVKELQKYSSTTQHRILRRCPKVTIKVEPT